MNELQYLLPFEMNLEMALALTGGLSNPDKMPCKAYALPTEACKKGWKLRNSEGDSVMAALDYICKKCYAKGHHFTTGIVNVKMVERLLSLKNPQWEEAMAFLLNFIESKDVFRWHDSGDLQGVWHLRKIVSVAEMTPSVSHWLPTIEYDMVEDYLNDGGVIPKNLHIMLSAEVIDKPEEVRRIAKRLNKNPLVKNKMGISWVTRNEELATCEATTIRKRCEHCRFCWNVMETVYYLH